VSADEPLLELVIDGPPVSHQARRRERVREYTREESARAAVAFAGAEPHAGMVRVEITFFFDKVAGDVDNIAKAILDGLKGIVIADDAQVMDVLASKRRIADARFIDLPEQLVRWVARGREFIHVRVLPFNLRKAASA
jgi:Holliday junction resolvase RusA-like endonuclease